MFTRSFVLLPALLAAALGIAGCGGGGSSTPNMYATAAPAATPTPGPTPAGPTTLTEVTLLGAAGFVNTNGRTVYILSDDTVGALACTIASGCTGVWPPVSPPSGVALSTGFTAFARSDNQAMQLAYNNHPLYEYSGDAAANQTNGNGLVSFGGTWSIARP